MAIIKGIEYIICGKADVVVAGGAEMSHPFIRHKFALESTKAPIREMGPGFRPSEAVCLFVLHKEDDERFVRGQRYGTIEGWTSGFSACCKPITVLAEAMKSTVAQASAPLAAVV